MWLMFDNAWAYNKKTSRVYKYCSKLSEVFDQHIDEAMKQLGYCCGMRVSVPYPHYVSCVFVAGNGCLLSYCTKLYHSVKFDVE